MGRAEGRESEEMSEGGRGGRERWESREVARKLGSSVTYRFYWIFDKMEIRLISQICNESLANTY